jgi:hypothetical protein
MIRVIDLLSVLLLVGSVVAFVLGFLALGDRRDLAALYWLVVGALALRASTNLLRPKTGSR